MRPLREMDERTAACLTNLKKAMNDSYLVIDYLEGAERLAPSSDAEQGITAAVLAMGMVQELIQECVSDLTK